MSSSSSVRSITPPGFPPAVEFSTTLLLGTLSAVDVLLVCSSLEELVASAELGLLKPDSGDFNCEVVRLLA